MPTKKIVEKLEHKLRTESDLLRCVLAEFLGTFVLVTLVNGTLAGMTTSRRNDNYLRAAFGTQVGVALGVWCAYGISGSHLNPAVSIALVVTGKCPWRRFPLYVLAQFLGAIIGCILCFLVYYDGINYIDGGDRQVFDHENATCTIFTTFPAHYVTMTTAFFEQIVNTGILLALVLVVADRRNAGPVPGIAPLIYSFIVFAVVLSYGVNTGAALNPARDFAGRLMCAMAGYGPEVWAPYGVQYWWIPTFGPMIGGPVGAWTYLIFVEMHHPPEEEPCPNKAVQLKGNTEYLDPRVSFQGSSNKVFAYGIAFYQGLWAYDGWNQLNFVTEELINPERNIPLGIVIGIPMVTIVYLLTNIAYFAVMSPEEMLTSSAVAITFANRTLGPAAWIIPVFVCCSTFGAANGTLFTTGRLTYVAGREGHMVKILSMVNPVLFTPVPALLFTSVLAIAMLIPNDFDTLVNYFSFSAWIFYGLTTLAVVVLRITHPEWRRPVKVPLILPIFVTVISVYLVVAPIIDAPEWGYLYASIFILAGLLLYYPLVYRGYTPGFMDTITVFFQQLLQVAPTYYWDDIYDNDDNTNDSGIDDRMELVEKREVKS